MLLTKKIFLAGGLILLSFSIGACAVKSTPADAVESYLDAIVEKDVVRASNLSCLAWEEDAYAEASSFETVEVRLEGVECKVVADQGDYQRVNCVGEIIANYGGEDQDIPLEDREFFVIEEGGEWRMCGYSVPAE
jgi:hypothetical protein